jgi:hypothetical protein
VDEMRVDRESDGVLIDPYSGKSVFLDSSARRLKILLPLVTSGWENRWDEKLGLAQFGIGQNHNTSGPSASRSLKDFVDIPMQPLWSQW